MQPGGFNLLCKWMCGKGFKAEQCHLQPHEFHDTGRGMMATQTLKPGETVIEVPDCLIITSQTALEGDLGCVFEKHQKRNLSAMQVMAIFLQAERHRGTSSPWWPYIQSLPKTFQTPVFWDERKVRCLPVFLQEIAGKQRTTIQRLYQDAKIVTSDIESNCPTLKGAFSEESFCWAWACINTRCVFWKRTPHRWLSATDQDNYALVPMLDLLNHSSESKVEASYVEADKCYRIKTLSTCPQNSQVFIHYGCHDNTALLTEYGFVLDKNPYNKVVFDMDELISFTKGASLDIQDIDTKYHLIRKICSDKGMLCLEEGLSWSLTTTLRILTLEQKHLPCWEQCLDECDLSHEHGQRWKQLANTVLQKKMNHLQYTPAGRDSTCPVEAMIAVLCMQLRMMLMKCVDSIS